VVDFGAKQSQKASRFVRRGDADGTDRLPDGRLGVRSGHDVFNRGHTYIGTFFAVEEAQLFGLHLQRPFGIVFDSGKSHQLDRFNGL